MAGEIVEPIEMLRRLVAFDTTSRNSNLALIEYVQGYLKGHGVESKLVPSEDGKWLRRLSKPVFGPHEYPGVGVWPRDQGTISTRKPPLASGRGGGKSVRQTQFRRAGDRTRTGDVQLGKHVQRRLIEPVPARDAVLADVRGGPQVVGHRAYRLPP